MPDLYSCPLCESTSHFSFEKNGYPIQECDKCYHRFVAVDLSVKHTDVVYNDDYFMEGGAGYADYTAEASLLTRHGEFYGNLVNGLMPAGTILDIGAAAGYILQGFHNTGWKGDGIEPNEMMVHFGREQLGLNLKVGSFEDFSSDKTYDLVSMIQVIAHFYDLDRAIQVACDAVRPDGYLLVETWDVNSLPARLLGSYWHEYSPPSVLHWFSEANVTAYLKQHGFRYIKSGRPQKYIKTGHAKSLIKYKLHKHTILRPLLLPLMSLIPDNVTVPYPKWDLFWGIYQKI